MRTSADFRAAARRWAKMARRERSPELRTLILRHVAALTDLAQMLDRRAGRQSEPDLAPLAADR